MSDFTIDIVNNDSPLWPDDYHHSGGRFLYIPIYLTRASSSYPSIHPFGFFFFPFPTNQLIREITEAKTQKWTLPPKDMSLKIERVSRAKFWKNQLLRQFLWRDAIWFWLDFDSISHQKLGQKESKLKHITPKDSSLLEVPSLLLWEQGRHLTPNQSVIIVDCHPTPFATRWVKSTPLLEVAQKYFARSGAQADWFCISIWIIGLNHEIILHMLH